MKRYYYISEDLDGLEQIERELEEAGVTTPQIHILSDDDTDLDRHKLHRVEPVLKKDVVHGTEMGALIGVLGAALVLLLAWWSGLTASFTW
ncbi:MAG: NAD/FAD-utilizing enzyme, partial [Gammaproteobacteria bacterium]|nr:NAD/FAD-utilizing enzyme [Gammaproteobacteria bacterium]